MYMTSDTIEPGSLLTWCKLEVFLVQTNSSCLLGRILKIPVRESQTEATKLVPSPPPPKPQITPPKPKVEKVDDFFKQIDLGIKSSKSRLNKVDSQVLETLENQDTFYDGYIKLWHTFFMIVKLLVLSFLFVVFRCKLLRVSSTIFWLYYFLANQNLSNASIIHI